MSWSGIVDSGFLSSCTVKDNFRGPKGRTKRPVSFLCWSSGYSSCDNGTLMNFGHQLLEIAGHDQSVSNIINFNTLEIS